MLIIIVIFIVLIIPLERIIFIPSSRAYIAACCCCPPRHVLRNTWQNRHWLYKTDLIGGIVFGEEAITSRLVFTRKRNKSGDISCFVLIEVLDQDVER
ncbi:hypothetical protein L596_016515 [Steinernema carpocapsae]|uniref:Uncharacterized protein n=1 Tax=Steinernema carpocapsae TaxID=34508 RepID=A0A4U5NJ63_STECR|nr:hypothetical protein L596_016515 [Steinernema carpocapsae]